MRWVILAPLLVTLPALAAAQDGGNTGNEWLERCRTNELPCSIYISGVLEGMQVQAQLSKQPLELCVQAGMSRKQITSIVLKYLHDNPAQRHHPFQFIVAVALSPHLKC
jgi:hypothetical protein